MSEEPPRDALARLGEKLDKARRRRLRQDRSGRGAVPQRALGVGMRIAIELVASLCVGLALGWVIDRVLGTRPWGLIVFFFLGSAAGMLNVFRAAKNMGSGGPPPAAGPRQDRDLSSGP